jgi:hypothetical protein
VVLDVSMPLVHRLAYLGAMGLAQKSCAEFGIPVQDLWGSRRHAAARARKHLAGLMRKAGHRRPAIQWALGLSEGYSALTKHLPPVRMSDFGESAGHLSDAIDSLLADIVAVTRESSADEPEESSAEPPSVTVMPRGRDTAPAAYPGETPCAAPAPEREPTREELDAILGADGEVAA